MSSKVQDRDDAERYQLDVFEVGNEVSAPPEIEPPPDGGYGWVCVAACFNINCFTWGVVSVSLRSTVSVFPIQLRELG